MSRASKLTPIEQRRNQIERELEKLKLPKNQKKASDSNYCAAILTP
jgi:hypothetical protein